MIDMDGWEYHQTEAMKNFRLYHAIQARIEKYEESALRAAKNDSMATHLLSRTDSLRAFEYQQMCKNRATFITLANMHATLATMLK